MRNVKCQEENKKLLFLAAFLNSSANMTLYILIISISNEMNAWQRSLLDSTLIFVYSTSYTKPSWDRIILAKQSPLLAENELHRVGHPASCFLC